MKDRDDSAPLVTVLETSEPALLAVAKSILEDAGIEFAANGEGLQSLFGQGQIAINAIVGPVRLQVAAEDAQEAMALLQELAEPSDDQRDPGA